MKQWSIGVIREQTADGLVSAREMVEASIDAIDELNTQLNSFTFVDHTGARARAARLDEGRARGRELGPLHGVPMGVKDCIDVQGLPTSCGVPTWTQRVAHRTCDAVKRLQDAGAILIGKTNLHECALGVTTSNPAFGAGRNPWDASLVPGGSSGGSASAVAAGMVAFALGTDTGGSIRIPASLCGVSGLRPTTGLIASDGVWPLASSFDCLGPIALSVEDISTVFRVLSTATDRLSDEISDPSLPVDLAYVPIQDLGRMTGGIQDAYLQTLRQLESCGFRLVEMSIPSWTAIEQVFSVVALFEISRRHQDRAEFSQEVLEIMQEGDQITDAAYARALEQRRVLWPGVEDAIDGHGALVLPSTSHEAVEVGARSILWPDGEDESLMNALSRFSYMASLFGLPAISVPMGLVDTLPAGLQLVGNQNEDVSLLGVAGRVEKALANTN